VEVDVEEKQLADAKHKRELQDHQDPCEHQQCTPAVFVVKLDRICLEHLLLFVKLDDGDQTNAKVDQSHYERGHNQRKKVFIVRLAHTVI